MVYIRIKQVKNIGYAYLVESKWNKEKQTSQQIIKQYLGPASQITINKIPKEYRNKSRIIKFLAKRNLDFTKSVYTLLDFYEKILIPVLYKVGDQWEKGEIDVATEHVCSNAVNTLIDLINQNNIKKISKSYRDTKSIVLCTPEGELHSIGCKIIESLLLEQGYEVYNITSPLPTNSLASFLDNTNPGIVLISVTLQENINSAIRLVKEIRKSFQISVMVGGNAIKSASKSQVQLL